MTEVNGLVNSVQRVARGSEFVAAAAIGATTLFVDSAEDFDNAGGDIEINAIRYVYTASDIETDTITLAAPGLTATADVGDGVLLVLGGQIAIDHIAYVTMGEGDEAEVEIPYADRTLWPEGTYLDPVPVVMSNDLTTIVSVPGRVPVIDGVVFRTATTGERIVVRNDGSGGVIEFFTGLPGEVLPSTYDPFVATSRGTGTPGVIIKSGTTAAYGLQGKITLTSGDTGFPTAPQAVVEANDVRLVSGDYMEFRAVTPIRVLADIDSSGGAVFSGSAHALDLYSDGQTGTGTVGASLTNQGRLIRTPSTRRVKKNIKPMTRAERASLLDLVPKTFQLRSEKDGPRYPGFIAEEVAEAGAELWVTRDNDGEPDGVRYAEMVVALVAEVKVLRAEVDALKAATRG